MKALKGVSASRMFKVHPELKQRLLERTYVESFIVFVTTVSENTEEQIRHYIQNQQINHK